MLPMRRRGKVEQLVVVVIRGEGENVGGVVDDEPTVYLCYVLYFLRSSFFYVLLLCSSSMLSRSFFSFLFGFPSLFPPFTLCPTPFI